MSDRDASASPSLGEVVSYLGMIHVTRRWRRHAGVALLVGLTAAVSLTSIAGARRTQSAHTRFLEAVNASDLTVSAGRIYDAEKNAEIASDPSVAQSRTYVGLDVAILDDQDRPNPNRLFEATGTLDGLYFDQDRFTATKGRVADRTRPDEVVVNEFGAAQLGLEVGDAITVGTYVNGEMGSPSFYTDPPPPATRTSAIVVGIGLFPDEVLQDEADRVARVLFTPAFSNASRPSVTYALQGLVLGGGATDVPAVRERLDAAAPSGTFEFQETSTIRAHALRALRPLSIALAAFGVITGLASVLLGAQATRRVIRLGRAERATLDAFGIPSRALALATLVGPCVAVVAGAALAVAVAVVASPVMPIGPVRRVEVSPGVDVDLTVLGIGAAVVVMTLFTVAAITVVRELPHRQSVRRVRRPAVVGSLASSAGLGPAAVAGLRAAFERAEPRGVPARSIILGAIVAVAAMVGALTFGKSLDTLVAQPRLYGWNWHAALSAANGYGDIDASKAREILDADDEIVAWAGVYFGLVSIGQHAVPLLGLDPLAAVSPPLLRGRELRTDGEVLLGSRTARTLDAELGDTVVLEGSTLTVVGIAVLPSIGPVHTAHVSLGDGAVVDFRRVPGWDLDLTGVHRGDFGPNAFFVRFASGTDDEEALAHLRSISAPLRGFAGLDVLGEQRPAEIVNASSVGTAPVLLGGLLAVGATVSLGLAIGTSLRLRRRELAILRTLGFTSRQLVATVGWQSIATVIAGLIVGIPLGVAIGHLSWRQFAGQLEVVARTTVAFTAVLGVVLAALTVATVVAVLHARSAAHIDAAQILRER